MVYGSAAHPHPREPHRGDALSVPSAYDAEAALGHFGPIIQVRPRVPRSPPQRADRTDRAAFAVRLFALAGVLFSVALGGVGAAAQTLSPRIPVLVPVTGFLSLEGTSQRNGALLALGMVPNGAEVTSDVIDTGTAPEGAVTALRRALEAPNVVAVAASMLGTQMLAMLPIAAGAAVPLVTVSGTAQVTEQGNDFVFRFFPADPVAKAAHARYIVEALGHSRPALLTQTTAYGQSGRKHLLDLFEELGADVVFEDSLDTGVKDMVPVIIRALQADPDVFVLHLHSGPSALFVRQAKALGITQPIVGGSALHQPSTAALLAPAELAGVCAESASSPISQETPGMADFVAEYRARFDREPDAFALGQYDGINMVLEALLAGARTPRDVRDWLATHDYRGLAMNYRSDGRGNMAHSAVILCYDGLSRIPRIVRRYEDLG